MASKTRLTDEEPVELFDVQLPRLLEERPELELRIYHAFMKAFATKTEVAAVLSELRGFRTEVDQRFDQVDRRFDQVDRRFDQVDRRFDQVDQRFDHIEGRLERLEVRQERGEERLDRVEARLDSLETRMEAGFLELHKAIDRLGSRWGIRNESIFRQTMAELLEKSFGA